MLFCACGLLGWPLSHTLHGEGNFTPSLLSLPFLLDIQISSNDAQEESAQEVAERAHWQRACQASMRTYIMHMTCR